MKCVCPGKFTFIYFGLSIKSNTVDCFASPMLCYCIIIVFVVDVFKICLTSLVNKTRGRDKEREEMKRRWTEYSGSNS